MYVYVYRWQMRIYGSRALRHTAWLARHLAVKRAKVSWPRAKGKFGMISGIRDAEFDRELTPPLELVYSGFTERMHGCLE
jgi:hypothetical protein